MILIYIIIILAILLLFSSFKISKLESDLSKAIFIIMELQPEILNDLDNLFIKEMEESE